MNKYLNSVLNLAVHKEEEIRLITGTAVRSFSLSYTVLLKYLGVFKYQIDKLQMKKLLYFMETCYENCQFSHCLLPSV